MTLQKSRHHWNSERYQYGEKPQRNGENHQELAYYVTSHFISRNWRRRRIYRSVFKTKETMRSIWNKHTDFIKNHDKQRSRLLSIQTAWYSFDSSNQLQLSCLRREVRDMALLIPNSDTMFPSQKSSTKGQTPFGNARRLLSCSLSFPVESFLTLDKVLRNI